MQSGVEKRFCIFDGLTADNWKEKNELLSSVKCHDFSRLEKLMKLSVEKGIMTHEIFSTFSIN